jgi:hypothetical protein
MWLFSRKKKPIVLIKCPKCGGELFFLAGKFKEEQGRRVFTSRKLICQHCHTII